MRVPPSCPPTQPVPEVALKPLRIVTPSQSKKCSCRIFKSRRGQGSTTTWTGKGWNTNTLEISENAKQPTAGESPGG